MNNRPLKNFFTSGFQAISMQLLGGAFFYLLSVFLSKQEFGVLNWSTAISVFITTLLGFGLEQVVVRRVALNSTSDWAASAYFLHTAVGSVVSFIVLATFLWVYDSDRMTLRMLPWVFVTQCFIFMATPFRQYLNAKEQFGTYGLVSFVSNIIKIGVVLYLAPQYRLNLEVVLRMLIITSFAELAVLFFYVRAKFDLNFTFKFSAYKKLIKESSAQYMAVLFDSSLSRMDWILLGLISAQMALADYSFAYRAYEMMRLPIMIVGPVILPRFARMLSSGAHVSFDKRHEIQQLLKMETVFAGLLILVLNLLWVPVVDSFTDGKYGASNQVIFMLLSVCLPLHFATNLFWTLIFSAKKYRYITIATVITASSNIILNLALIPFLGGIGAAIAYAASTLIQTLIYCYVARRKVMRCNLYPLLIVTGITCLSYFAAVMLTGNLLLRIAIAVVVFVPLIAILKQLGKEHVSILKSYMQR
ncbi:MAG TPA: oligosaccharide flippase family protein [Flavipsychrobacter sp.]|nr:oligosaccharide flippase family protein [Flavipsychrobacter sp.]